MIKVILIYWIATTVYGVYWLIKNPSQRRGHDMEYYTLLDVVAFLLPAFILAPFFVPLVILDSFRFKRPKK